MSILAKAIDFLRAVKSGQQEEALLTSRDYQEIFEEILVPESNDDEIKDFLRIQAQLPLNEKMLTAAVSVLTKVQNPVADLPANLPANLIDQTIDTCGTGGDGHQTFNISTTSSFVVAGAGGKVAKHGNRSASSKSGSADCLEALGISLQLDGVKSLVQTNLAFFFAPLFHPALKRVATIRKQLGIRTIFNFLGPLLNPLGAKFQVIGVSDEKAMEPIAKTLSQMPISRAWIVHGRDKMDEISLTAPTLVKEISSRRVSSFILDPKDYGFAYCDLNELKGGAPKENAQITERILKGEKGPPRDIVLLNAASALTVSGVAKDFSAGIGLCKKSIDEGRAFDILTSLRKMSA